MALLRYFKPRDGLPDLQGSLSLSVPSQPIARTYREVEVVIYSQVEGMKRGPYVRYSPEERAKVTQYACHHGIAVAAR